MSPNDPSATSARILAVVHNAAAMTGVVSYVARPRHDKCDGCQDFQKNSDGKWTSSSNATIGKMDFGSHTFGVGEVDIGGADLATVLNRKCVAQ
jgi:hypothetical protein